CTAAGRPHDAPGGDLHRPGSPGGSAMENVGTPPVPQEVQGTINVGSGHVTLAASSIDSALVKETRVTLGLIRIGVSRPVVEASGAARSHLGGDYNVSASA